jgi:hypothetical protein
MNRASPVVTGLLLLALAMPARAQEGGKGITFSSRTQTGVEATAHSYSRDRGGPASTTHPTSHPPTTSPPPPVVHSETGPAFEPSMKNATSEVPAPTSVPVGFGCPGDIGSFRFSDIYGRCEISVPAPIEEPERDDRRRRRGEPRGPSLEEIRQQVIDRAIALAPAPELQLAPARIGLTGLPSYFWLGNDPQPISATASVRGVTVTATATPTHFVWSFGDGNERTTTKPGRPWTKRSPGSIEHTYETEGVYEVGATIVWSASWSLNGGAPQSLGTFTTSDAADHPVREVIAFLTDD